MPIKIGDRVRIVDDTDYDFRVGQTGVVVAIKGDRILVVMDEMTYKSVGDGKTIHYRYWFPFQKLRVLNS